MGRVLVSGVLLRDDAASHPVVTLTDDGGRWLLNLGNLRDGASGGVLPYEAGDLVVLRYEAGIGVSGRDTIVVAGASPQDCGVYEMGGAAGAGRPEDDTPLRYELAASHPNPFRGSTTIGFAIPAAGRVGLNVYDVSGRRVAVLADGHYEPGRYAISWDGRSAAGHQVSSGIYFYRLEAGDFVRIRRMFLVK
jgi:hypothetical protein